jgi:hypothetical protein
MIRIQGIPVVAERLQAGQSIVGKLAGHVRARSPWPRTLRTGNEVQSSAGREPRSIIEGIERHPLLPPGTEDRFAGYAVIGLPFRSGHVLLLRRFPASSVGPGYTSVWHRDPAGRWTIYSTVAPEQGCSRYFGREIESNVVAPIHVEWLGPAQFLVVVEDAVTWEVTLAETAASRVINTAARLLPESWWRKRFVLSLMGTAARLALGTGQINLAGRTPNGQEFVANPRQVWLVKSSRAIIRGVDAGVVGPLINQARLRDFLIPQRGVFAVVRSFLRTASDSHAQEANEEFSNQRTGLAPSPAISSSAEFASTSTARCGIRAS